LLKLQVAGPFSEFVNDGGFGYNVVYYINHNLQYSGTGGGSQWVY
jgi:hypothetical protein